MFLKKKLLKFKLFKKKVFQNHDISFNLQVTFSLLYRILVFYENVKCFCLKTCVKFACLSEKVTRHISRLGINFSK